MKLGDQKNSKEQNRHIRNVNEIELQMLQNNISLEKKIIEKSINGKGEHVSVDVLEQRAMTDGIFLGYDGKHENSMTAKGDQQSAK